MQTSNAYLMEKNPVGLAILLLIGFLEVTKHPSTAICARVFDKSNSAAYFLARIC